jgi:hypothetical protein
MTNRVSLAITFVISGILCVAVTIVAVAWMDNVARHERSAEIQAVVQADLQGKVPKELTPYSGVLSPLMVWITYGMGSYLVATGFMVGIRSLSTGVSPHTN